MEWNALTVAKKAAAKTTKAAVKTTKKAAAKTTKAAVKTTKKHAAHPLPPPLAQCCAIRKTMYNFYANRPEALSTIAKGSFTAVRSTKKLVDQMFRKEYRRGSSAYMSIKDGLNLLKNVARKANEACRAMYPKGLPR